MRKIKATGGGQVAQK